MLCKLVKYFVQIFYCPNKEAAMGIIVVSLPCTSYQRGSLIVLCFSRYSTGFGGMSPAFNFTTSKLTNLKTNYFNKQFNFH